jgi:hypothetical protein
VKGRRLKRRLPQQQELYKNSQKRKKKKNKKQMHHTQIKNKKLTTIPSPIFFTIAMSYIIKATPQTTGHKEQLEEFLETSQIPYHVIPAAPSETYIASKSPILNIARPPVRFKPTFEYKLFAGSEYMSSKGTVTFNDVLERIYTYARVNNLLTDYGFKLDTSLYTVLRTTSVYIDWQDLYQHIELLFTKV